MNEPNAELARRIFDRLVAEGLLDERDASNLRESMAAGRTSPESWRVAFENTLARQKNGVEP